MSVGEICHREVVTTDKKTTVIDAAKVMRDNHVGCLIIIDQTAEQHKPLGVITDRDLVVEVLAMELDLSALTVEDLMAPELLLARETDGIWETILRMRAMGVRRLPVIDEDGTLCGVITMDDLLVFLADELSDLAKLIKREAEREQKIRPPED